MYPHAISGDILYMNWLILLVLSMRTSRNIVDGQSIGQSTTATRIGDVITRIHKVHDLVLQVIHLEPLPNVTDHYIGSAEGYLEDENFIISFTANLVEDTSVADFRAGVNLHSSLRGFTITPSYIIFTLESEPRAILYYPLDFPNRTRHYGIDGLHQYNHGYKFLVESNQQTFKEGGDAKNNSFSDPSSLVYDYNTSKLYVMDQTSIRYIDMKSNKAYTIYSDSGPTAQMGINKDSQKGFITLDHDGHLWLAFAFGIAELQPDQTDEVLQVYVGRPGIKLYYDGNFSDARFTPLSSFAVWHGEVVIASNANTDHSDPYGFRVIDLHDRMDGRVTSVCHHAVDHSEHDTVDGPASSCTSERGRVLMIVDYNSRKYAILSEPDSKIRITEIHPRGQASTWFRLLIAISILATIVMMMCVCFIRFGCLECCEYLNSLTERKRTVRMNPNELDKTGTGNINHWYKGEENKDEKDEKSGKLKKNPLNVGNDDDDVPEGHKRTKQEFWEGAGEVGEGKPKKDKKDKKRDNMAAEELSENSADIYARNKKAAKKAAKLNKEPSVPFLSPVKKDKEKKAKKDKKENN